MTSEFRLGRGKIGSYLSSLMGGLALGAVVCFHFPQYLTTPEFREIYPVQTLRVLINVFIAASVGLALLGIVLGYRGRAPLLGFTFSLGASLLGAGSVEYQIPVVQKQLISFDWFLLDLLILSFIFVPLERIFALKKNQLIFREQWRLDLLYFFINHFLLQVLLVVTFIVVEKPIESIRDWAQPLNISTLNPIFQFALIVLAVDFVQYWVHRAFHRFPILWRIHAIHHSSKVMDWLAGSRLHLLDIIVTRAALLIPLHSLGFSITSLQSYLVFAAFQTVYIHSNTRLEWKGLRWVLTTPAFHHWHHSSENNAIDKNFSVHLPLYDCLFGTLYFPKGQWPNRFGLAHEELPTDYAKQFFYFLNK